MARRRHGRRRRARRTSPSKTPPPTPTSTASSHACSPSSLLLKSSSAPSSSNPPRSTASRSPAAASISPRKLIANAHNEDEIAGVIAHEIGHILSHQFAKETTADMKRLLGVTSVTDRADIYANSEAHGRAPKTQNLKRRRYRRKTGRGRQRQRLRHCRRRLPPAGLLRVLGPFLLRQRKRGQQALRLLRRHQTRFQTPPRHPQARQRHPAGLRRHPNTASAEFLQWQQRVIANQAVAKVVSTPAAAEVVLTPPLRMSLQHLRFSRDGKYILAQDESSIFVLSRDPYKLLFRFDAEDSLPLASAPTPRASSFNTPRLHTEQWSVTTQKLIAAHEPVARHDCLQTELSPTAEPSSASPGPSTAVRSTSPSSTQNPARSSSRKNPSSNPPSSSL